MSVRPEYHNLSLKYPGGKSKVAKKIIEEFPPHTKYVEPFSGVAHVFFQKTKADSNVLNDTNRELIRFFRDIKGKKVCCDLSGNREKFNRIRAKNSKSICDQIYLNKASYGGHLSFGAKPFYGNDKKLEERGQYCVDGSKLKGVTLTTDDYKTTIKKHDSKDTLFYLDPPYMKANAKECLYGKDNCQVRPEEVASVVKKIKGTAIVSYDDHPQVRKAFKDCKVRTITLPYAFAKNKNKKLKGDTKELLIKC